MSPAFPQEFYDLLDASASYPERKVASEKIDQILGFRIPEVEERIRSSRSGRTNWSQLSEQVFQTPYGEFAEIIRRIDPNSQFGNWVDLGAGYGRLGIVLAALLRSARFHGIELEVERVREGERILRQWKVGNSMLVTGDLAEQTFPSGEVYFIYDFGSADEIRRVLETLRERALRETIRVVGRGRRVRDLIERENPWLAEVVDPIHTENYSVYRSAEG